MNSLKKILTTVIIIISIYITVLITIPLKEIYSFANQYISKKYNITVMNKKTTKMLNKLKLKDVKIYINNNINIASIDKINFITYLFYNKINIQNLKILLNNMLIKNLIIKYKIFSNQIYFISDNNNISKKIYGYFDLKTKTLKIFFIVPNLNKIFFMNIKKIRDGVYYYEYKF